MNLILLLCSCNDIKVLIKKEQERAINPFEDPLSSPDRHLALAGFAPPYIGRLGNQILDLFFFTQYCEVFDLTCYLDMNWAGSSFFNSQHSFQPLSSYPEALAELENLVSPPFELFPKIASEFTDAIKQTLQQPSYSSSEKEPILYSLSQKEKMTHYMTKSPFS
jgi:hypothetical protein